MEDSDVGGGVCTYTSTDGSVCGRNNINDTDYCAVHYGWDLTSEELRSLPTNGEFQEAFAKLLADCDGNWQGFVFTAGMILPDQIEFPIVARGCRFESLEITKTVFLDTVDFSESVFSGTTELRGVRFQTTSSFARCRFTGPVSFLNVIHEGAADFHRAEFSDRTIIRANFSSTAIFNEAVFRSAVSFAGWRNVSAKVEARLGAGFSAIGQLTCIGGKPPTAMQRLRGSIMRISRRMRDVWDGFQKAIQAAANVIQARYRRAVRRFSTTDPDTTTFRVFEGDGQLQGVIFMQPEQTSFSQLDMSNVYVKGTNFNGVHFLAVNWWQPQLGRNGLRDELFIRKSPDGPFRFLELPALEETCRNVRVALEDSRSFNLASDFYVAEMEALRARLSFLQRHFFSIPAVYLWASKYGTSVGQALRVFAELVVLYVGLTLLLSGEPNLLEETSKATLQSLQLLVFQAEHDASGAAQSWLDAVFRVMGLIQVTMLVFAFRSRIKRS